MIHFNVIIQVVSFLKVSPSELYAFLTRLDQIIYILFYKLFT
jgi:hypothetical protein